MNNIFTQNLTPTIASMLVFTALLFSSCSPDQYYQPDDFLDSIADTINTAEGRQVFMADGTGGYYFDDAFRENGRSEYGFSRGERRILAGWSLIDDAGSSLIVDQEYAVTHPERIEFHYKNGLTTTIKIPMGIPGLIVSFEQKKKSTMIFRPEIDMRKLDREETPSYNHHWDSNRDVMTVSRNDSLGGWVAMSSVQRTLYRDSENFRRLAHEASGMIGSPDVSVSWSPGEFELKKGRKFTIILSWGKDEVAAIENMELLTIIIDSISIMRQQWALSVLDPINIKCDDLEFIKGYAWARLVAAQLSVDVGDKEMLMTGIPFDPYPHGFYTSQSILGLRAMGYADDRLISILKNLVSFQNHDIDLSRYGMIPGAITEDGPEYRIPELAGMVRYILNKFKRFQVVDSASIAYFAWSLRENLRGTSRFRLKNGMVNSRGDEYLLWDSPNAASRAGATIESQVLLSTVMRNLYYGKSIESKYPDLPQIITSGSGSLEQRLQSGDLWAFGQSGEYTIPLRKDGMYRPFVNYRDKTWVDLLQIDGGQINKISSSSFSQFLARYWQTWNYYNNSKDVMQNLTDSEVIGKSGLRTMSPHSAEYNSEHKYLMPDSPRGTMTKGDIMVWSSGMLADTYWNLNAFDDITKLRDELTQRVLFQGVVGGLPEAEQPESDNILTSPIGNSIFLASITEYLRIIEYHILGIRLSHGIYFSIIPDFKESWGETELVIKNEWGTITVHLINPQLYRITQTGILPHLNFNLNPKYSLQDNGRTGLMSADIYPNEEVFIHFKKNESGKWVGITERK